jgi:hypothetical protein
MKKKQWKVAQGLKKLIMNTHSKGKLGTWLTGIASQNRKSKKLDVKKKITEISLIFKTGKYKYVFARLIEALSKRKIRKKKRL